MMIEEKALLAFFEECATGKIEAYSEVVVPVSQKNVPGQFVFSSFSQGSPCVLDQYRAVDPLKMLFYMPRETVLPVSQNPKMRIIAGAKACDIRAMQVLDAALSGEDFVDPVYKLWREQTVVISADCTDSAATCHCTLVGGKPFAETGFDVNLSRIPDRFVLTAGSAKGEALLNVLQSRVEVHTESESIRKTIQENRKKITDQVKCQNQDLERSDQYAHLRSDKDENWPAVSETCIGCGACTNICPTCYCLILNDETKAQQFVKVRSFDSCQWNGYARVAGGATPRPKMFERFRNRYLCKFLFMKSNFDLLGCTGCGRCTEACAGNIDFRKVVKRVTDRMEMAVLT